MKDRLLLDIETIRSAARVCQTVWIRGNQEKVENKWSDEYGEIGVGFNIEVIEDIEYSEVGL